jgi:hypothetical protein
VRSYTKSLEELIELQDKAIVALKQANQALQLALDALQKTRDEQGYAQPLFPQTLPFPSVPYSPYSQPFNLPNTAGGTWITPSELPNSGTVPIPGAGSGWIALPMGGDQYQYSNSNVSNVRNSNGIGGLVTHTSTRTTPTSANANSHFDRIQEWLKDQNQQKQY